MDYHTFLPSPPRPLPVVDRTTQTNIFECHKCGSRLASKAFLRHHENIHAIVWECVWPECSNRFTTKQDCKKHMDAHTTEKFLPCAYCKKAFYNQELYKAHLKGHIDKPLFPCDKCSAKFDQKVKLRKHKQMHSQTKFVHLYTNPVIPDSINDVAKSNLLSRLKVFDFSESETDNELTLPLSYFSNNRKVLVSSSKKNLSVPERAERIKRVRVAADLKNLRTCDLSESETNSDQSEVNNPNHTVSQGSTTNVADQARSQSADVQRMPVSSRKRKLPEKKGSKNVQPVKFAVDTKPDQSNQSQPSNIDTSNEGPSGLHGVKNTVKRVTRSTQKKSNIAAIEKQCNIDANAAGPSKVYHLRKGPIGKVTRRMQKTSDISEAETHVSMNTNDVGPTRVHRPLERATGKRNSSTETAYNCPVTEGLISIDMNDGGPIRVHHLPERAAGSVNRNTETTSNSAVTEGLSNIDANHAGPTEMNRVPGNAAAKVTRSSQKTSCLTVTDERSNTDTSPSRAYCLTKSALGVVDRRTRKTANEKSCLNAGSSAAGKVTRSTLRTLRNIVGDTPSSNGPVDASGSNLSNSSQPSQRVEMNRHPRRVAVGFFKCQFCNFAGKTAQNYKKHALIHEFQETKRRLYPCSLCNAQLMSHLGLRSHLSHCH